VVVVDVVAGAVATGATVVAGAVATGATVVAGAEVVGAAVTGEVVVTGGDVAGATDVADTPVVGTVSGGVICTTGDNVSTGTVSTDTAATAGAEKLAPRAKIDNTATAARRLWVLSNTRRGPIGLLRPKSPQRSRRVPTHPHQVVEAPKVVASDRYWQFRWLGRSRPWLGPIAGTRIR